MSVASRKKKQVSAIKYLPMYVAIVSSSNTVCFVDCRFLQNNTITNITDATFSKLESLRYL